MSHIYFAKGIVDCPLDNIAAPRNISTSSTDLPYRYLLGSHSDRSVLRSIPYLSTTCLVGLLAVYLFVFAVVTPLALHGVVATRISNGRMRKIRHVTDATNNIMWALVFLTGGLRDAANVVFLQVEVFREVGEASRIAILLTSLFHGLHSVFLAFALNEQRMYRVQDYRGEKPSEQLQRQSRLLNRITLGIFILLMIGYFIVTHVTEDNETIDKVMSWVLYACYLFMSIPAMLASIWVSFHKAVVEPTGRAKVIILASVIGHTIVLLPSSFWNRAVLRTFVEKYPCPGSFLSFYDFIVILHFVVYGAMFAFVVMEYRRNAQILQSELYAGATQQLLMDPSGPDFPLNEEPVPDY